MERRPNKSLYNPAAIVTLFAKNRNQLKPWLSRIEWNMFTDYTGNTVEQLKELKGLIEASLRGYIERTTNKNERVIAQHILHKVMET